MSATDNVHADQCLDNKNQIKAFPGTCAYLHQYPKLIVPKYMYLM